VLDRTAAAVYLPVQQAYGSGVVAVLTSDSGLLAVGRRLSRPADHRLLIPVPAGSPAWIGRGGLTVGELTVLAASWWDPQPRLLRGHPEVLPEALAVRGRDGPGRSTSRAARAR